MSMEGEPAPGVWQQESQGNTGAPQALDLPSLPPLLSVLHDPP